MAIEPISSAMTYQVQNTPFTKPVTKPEAVDTDVASQDSAVPFDPTTAKIVETQESNTRGQDSNAGDNAREAAKEKNQASKE